MGIKVAESCKPDGTHYAWLFFCPACRALHQCDDRWTFNGDREKPTFRASILVYEVNEENYHRPRCHSFVTDGRIEYCGDSTHAMVGKTADLPDWDSVRDRYGDGYGGA